MNVREHIEAGHYPTDGKGRALVPTDHPDWTATIAATDAPGQWVLMGWRSHKNGIDCSQAAWFCDGRPGDRAASGVTLLPPSPRTVVRWAALSHEQLDALGMYESDGPAQREVCGGKMLTRIEYEVKWS